MRKPTKAILRYRQWDESMGLRQYDKTVFSLDELFSEISAQANRDHLHSLIITSENQDGSSDAITFEKSTAIKKM